jgi:hypothetical protein
VCYVPHFSYPFIRWWPGGSFHFYRREMSMVTSALIILLSIVASFD